MLFRPTLVFGFASLAACATAGPGQDQPTDAPPSHDAHHDDSSLPIDAPMQQPDAPNCSPVQMELLTNGNFDGTPLGNGWMETPIVAGDELVTAAADLGATADTAPNVAWMGGYARSGNNTDALYQDVAIPAGATALVLSGSYEIYTNDGFGDDKGHVMLASTTNTQLEAGLDVDDTDATNPTTPTWTPFSKTFNAAHAGQTVRIRVTTTGDSLLATTFFFDSLSLEATVTPQGCP